jgi:hypothetical protein
MIELLYSLGKAKAFTTSYDDGVNQDQRLVKIMNKHRIRGTFNLSAGLLGTNGRAVIDGFDTDTSKIPLNEICATYKGHEIACHAYTHPDLTKETSESIDAQLDTDRRTLEGETGVLVQGFAYPYGTYNELVLQKLKQHGIRYARTVHSTNQFTIPDEFLLWHPTCHHNEPRLMELIADFCTNPSYTGATGLFYLWGHSYEFDQRKNWDLIEKLFTYLDDYHEDIWFASNGDIESYVECYNRLQLSADESMIYNPSVQTVWIKYKGNKKEIQPGLSSLD